MPLSLALARRHMHGHGYRHGHMHRHMLQACSRIRLAGCNRVWLMVMCRPCACLRAFACARAMLGGGCLLQAAEIARGHRV